jgi:hypothetical protein
MKNLNLVIILLTMLIFQACKSGNKSKEKALFEIKDSTSTGVGFVK